MNLLTDNSLWTNTDTNIVTKYRSKIIILISLVYKFWIYFSMRVLIKEAPKTGMFRTEWNEIFFLDLRRI